MENGSRSGLNNTEGNKRMTGGGQHYCKYVKRHKTAEARSSEDDE